MKLIYILLISLSLVGCASLYPQQKQAILQDQQSFCQAFKYFQKTNQIKNLQDFIIDYPDSIWADRAETIILYSQELDQRKVQVGKLRKIEQQQTLELEQLKKQNQKLAETIEQLKGSLIQSEKHPK